VDETVFIRVKMAQNSLNKALRHGLCGRSGADRHL
jgi:hypothetical protein